jgi:transposase
MAEPYSQDLRERVVAAVDEGDTREEAAERLGVSVRFVYDMLRLRRETGSLAPRPHAGGKASAVDETARAKIRGLVAAKPDATLAELCRDLAGGGGGGPSIKKSRMGQVLQAMGLKRKKDAGGV